MRTLITGGSGYVGGRLGHSLAATGDDVVLASRTDRAAPSWLPNAKVRRLDWTDPSSIRAACADIDAIVHLAGPSAADAAAHPESAARIRRDAATHLATAARSAGIRRFVCISTAHVYASPLRGHITETTPLMNRAPYAVSHREGERAALAQARRGSFDVIVIRLSNAFGPPASADASCWDLLLNDLARQANATGRMVLRSSGLQPRDFVPMSEACRAIAHLLHARADQLDDGIFNVGGRSRSVLEMAEQLADRFAAKTGGRPTIERPQPSPDARADELEFDCAKLLASGFAPSADTVDGELDRLIDFLARDRSEGR